MNKDTRDLRDPQKLGEKLKELRYSHGGKVSPCHMMADELVKHKVPDYPKHDSVGSTTAAEYRRELQERADQGDRYAKSMLAGMPYDEPGD